MKNNSVYSAILMLFSGICLADIGSIPAEGTYSGETIQIAATNDNEASSTASPEASATNTESSTAPSATPASTDASAPTQAVTIDCNYHISAQTQTIDQSLVLEWSKNATEQSFDLDHDKINDQLQSLKACFTEQGWTSFYDALQKSGNMQSIQSQQLVVSSMVDGSPVISEVKDNQWKITLQLQVVYQNEKEKITQPLTVDLTVGRKINGDLGIMQLIATPQLKDDANTAAAPNKAS